MLNQGYYNFDYESEFPKSKRSPYIIVTEYPLLFKSWSNGLHPTFPQEAKDKLRNIANVYDEVPDVVFSCDVPRYLCYINNEYSAEVKKLLAWASDIVFRLGYTQVEGTTPVLEELDVISNFSRYLTLLSSLIIALLTLLSIFLIYNLMMGNVETRTFEMGNYL